jgi:SAM-dependent methyltransferase
MGIATDYQQLRPHRSMLRDTTRTFAFSEALSQLVTPESVVLDMGTGTGILGMLAARLGARRVYAVERTPIAETARKLIEDNQLQDTVTVIQADAATVELPEPVDVVVSEWLGGIGIDENMLPILIAVRDRHLRPSGVMIPSVVTSWAAPTFDPFIADELTYFDSRPYGLDLSRISALTAQELFYGRHYLTADQLVCPPQPMWRVDVGSVSVAHAKSFSARLEFRFDKKQTVNCLMMWFTATLAGTVRLSCSPDSATCWGRTVAPLRRPVTVPRATPLTVQVDVDPAGPGWVYTHWAYELDGKIVSEGDNRNALI